MKEYERAEARKITYIQKAIFIEDIILSQKNSDWKVHSSLRENSEKWFGQLYEMIGLSFY